MLKQYDFTQNGQDALEGALIKINQVLDHSLTKDTKYDLLSEALDLIERSHAEIQQAKNEIMKGWDNEW